MNKPIIAITRPELRAQAACDLVEEFGGKPYLAPTLSLEPVNTDSLKYLMANLNKLDWIIFTSPTTIEAIKQFYPDKLKDITCKVAVIGRKTGEVAEKNSIKVDLMPDNYTAEGLVEEFKAQNIKNNVIGVPRTASARTTLPEGLKELDNEVILAEAYKSLTPKDEDTIKELIAKILNNEIDAITFTSPLTVENLFKIAENKNQLSKKLSEDILTVSIGPITGNKLNEYSVQNIYPKTYTVKDMLTLLFQKLEGLK